MKKIGVKLALLFIAIIVASSILSFVATTLLSPNIPGVLRQNHLGIATSLRHLEDETSLDLETMIQIAATPVFNIGVYEGSRSTMPPQDLDKLEAQEVVFRYENGWLKGPKALVLIRGEVLEISLKPGHSALVYTAHRLWDSLLFIVGIGTLLALVITKRVVRPILRLSRGTQQVARGNFEVQIPVTSDDEVGILTANFNRMVKELKHMEILRKDFINNVSHEFKTPMASIKGFATLLKDPDLQPEQREEYINIIVKETDRLAHLSSNLLKLSKLENQEIPDAQEEFCLDEQIRRTVLLLEPKWAAKGLDIQLDLGEHLITGNEELLQQVWVNLLHNGIKFSHKGGLLRVASREDSQGITVEIEDHGKGMSEEIRERIFEKFYQGDTTHSEEGSGLGLPLVKRIVDFHGGSLQVDTLPGKGTTMRVFLPKTVTMDAEKEAGHA